MLQILIVVIVLAFASPVVAQIPNELQTAQAVANEGYFDKCAAGEMRACSYFSRLVAWRLNPTGDPNSWGWLSKDSGSNVEGWADDAIVYGADRQNNVIDLVGGSGEPGARVQWGEESPGIGKPRRPSNLWVAPRPLTAAELDYLKSGAGGSVTPTPSAGWEAKHGALLMRFPSPGGPNPAWVRRVAEQFAFSFPGEGWGVKSGDPSRPPSGDVMARSGGATLVGYRIVPPSMSPALFNLAGQHFIAVIPVNHLGDTAVVPPPPPHPGPTPPPVNQQAVLDAIAQLRALIVELRQKQDAHDAQLSMVAAAAVDAATQAAAAANGQQDTRNRVEDVLTAVDLARQQLANPPEYSGPAKFTGTITLKPRPKP